MLRIARQKGVVTLMLTIVVLMIVTLTTLYVSRVVVTDDKVFANTYRNNQALDAARAGFDYALGFLNASLLNQEMALTNNTITRDAALPGGNNLNRCSAATNTATLTAPGALANGATYTMTYRCITINDINTITIRSVGTSEDGSATRTVEGVVQRVQPTNATLVSAGNATLAAGADIVNTVNNSTHGILAGGTASVTGGGTTVTTSAGTCTSTATCATLGATTASDPNLTGLTTAALFETRFMGNTLSSFSTQADYVVTCNNSVAYTQTSNTLDPGGACTIASAPGVTPANPTWIQAAGRVVYFNMTTAGDNITFSETNAADTYGTAAAPVIMIVNATSVTANVTLANTAVFFGGIYTTDNLQPTGNTATRLNGVGFSSNDYTQDSGVDVNGVVMVRTTPLVTAGGTLINRNSATVLSYIMGGSVLGYALVPGSLKDF